MDDNSLRDNFYDYFSKTEKVENGKTFIGVPRHDDMSRTVTSTRQSKESPVHHRSLSAKHTSVTRTKATSRTSVDPMLLRSQDHTNRKTTIQARNEERAPLSTEEMTHMNQESLTVLHEREDSLEMHDTVVHDLIAKLDRAFQPPLPIYGDIHPEVELLPSQVTLLRLRRKRQDAAVARYRFQKAVTRYIMEWRTRMLRRYQTLHCRRRATRHFDVKCFSAWRAGFEMFAYRREFSRRAMGFAVATRLFKVFSLWRKREESNRQTRAVTRLFTPCFCAWRRWQRSLRRCVFSSLVVMQADITAYDFLLRKHGRLVLNVLHVKKPLVNPRTITKFARLQALKRGFRSIAHRYMDIAFNNGMLKGLARLKKKKSFSQWRSFVQYRVTRSSIRRKEKEVTTNHRLLQLATARVSSPSSPLSSTSSPACQPCKLGLQKYIHSWKQLSGSQIVSKSKTRRAKGHHYQRSAKLVLAAWWTASRHGCSAQGRSVAVAAHHLLHTKVQRCFTQWRSQVACQAEEVRSHSQSVSVSVSGQRHSLLQHSQQQHNNQKLVNYKKHYGRKCLLDNVQQKEHIVISKLKLDMATALILHTHTMWSRVSRAMEDRREFHSWMRENDRSARLLYAYNHQRGAMTTWMESFKQNKQEQQNIYLADMQYCIANMRSCWWRWHNAARLTVNYLQPAHEKAAAHHFRTIGLQLLQSLLRSGHLQRQQNQADKHWCTQKCSAVLATMLSVVNTRRLSAQRLVEADPSLLVSIASATRRDCDSRSRKMITMMISTEQQQQQQQQQTVVLHCSSSSRPSPSFFPLHNLLLCSRVYEERRKRRVTFQEWVGFLMQRRAEQTHQQQAEHTHHWPRLQLSGLRALADYVTYRSQLKNHDSEMDRWHDNCLSKHFLRQWRVHLKDTLSQKRVLKQMCAVRDRHVCAAGVTQWRRRLADRKHFQAEERASVPVFTKKCCIKLLKGLVAGWQQGKVMQTATRTHSRRSRVHSLQRWRERAQGQCLRRGLMCRSRVHERRWSWRLLRQRSRQYASNRRLCTAGIAPADKHRDDFRARRGVQKVRRWATRRKQMKTCFAALVARRAVMTKRSIFSTLVAYKEEGDALLLEGENHHSAVEQTKAFQGMREHLHRIHREQDVSSVADDFHLRQLQQSFFVVYQINIKLVCEKQKIAALRGAAHHVAWSQRGLLLAWRQGLVSRMASHKHDMGITSRFKQSRGLRTFTTNIQKMYQCRLHSNKLLEMCSSRSSKSALAHWTSRLYGSRKARKGVQKASHYFAQRWKMKVLTWLKHLRHLRYASTIVRTSYSKWRFASFRRRYLSTVLGRRLVVCTRRAVQKRIHLALKEALRRWAEHLRQENIACRLINMRTDRMFRQAVTQWSRGSTLRKALRLRGEVCVRSQQCFWQQHLAQKAFFNLSEQIVRSQRQRRLARKCKRHLFRTFRRRITENTCVHEEVAARTRFAASYYQKCSLRLGIRYLMYRVQMKYHRQHVAFLETREYRRAQLRHAVRRLHKCARRGKHRRRLHSALKTHCVAQKQRRVLQLLDCAVARRWGKQREREQEMQLEQQESHAQGGMATRRMHRGFRRLLQHRQRRRAARQLAGN